MATHFVFKNLFKSGYSKLNTLGNKNAVAVSCVFETATACPFCGYAGCSRVRKLSVHGDGVVVDNRVQGVFVADGCDEAVEDVDAAGSKCFNRS